VINNILVRKYGDPSTTLTNVSRIFQLLRRWEEKMEDSALEDTNSSSSFSSSSSLKPLVEILQASGLGKEAAELEKAFHWLMD